MTLPVEVSPLLLKSKGKYSILRSLRFRPNAYLRRLFTTPTNATTWSLSMWFKRGDLSRQQQLMGAFSATASTLGFNASDQFYMRSSGATVATSTAVFRDPNAWYNIVVISNGTTVNAYINNVQILSYTGTIALFNTAINHSIGRSDSGADYFNGYMTDVTFVDGQALTPSSFAQYDDVTFTWEPKYYSGSLGNNGFFLNFYDASATTATTLGKDQSGGGKNFTPTGFSVTAGTTYDSAYDTPSLTANTLYNNGNHCTLNLLDLPGTTGAVSGGGQDGNLPVDGSRSLVGTMPVSSGKWYWEVLCTSLNTVQLYGITPVTFSCKTSTQFAYQVANSVHYSSSGNKQIAGTGTAYGSSWTSNPDTIGVALDLTNSQITFYKNGVAQPTLSITAGVTYVPSFASGSTAANQTFSVNFGQKTFTYTPPSGFKALNAYNLPDALIMRPALYMDVSTYTGNGTSQSIVNTAGFQPDLVWIKDRSAARNNRIYDAIRGAALTLDTNTTNAEGSAAGGVTSFNTNGFSVGSGNPENFNAETFVAWQWREGVLPGIDVVTYTGNGTARTIAHALGVTPAMFITKRRDAVSSWRVYHRNASGTPQNGCMFLEGTQAFTTSTIFNNTAPTSTTFGVGTDPDVNASGGTYVAFLFTEVAGFSKFGSYTGNGVVDGPFVNCGFKPRFILIKDATAGTTNWIVHDTVRDQFNQAVNVLSPNAVSAETIYSTSYGLDVTSNGFKIRLVGAPINTTSDTHIYAAFADNPFKYTLAR